MGNFVVYTVLTGSESELNNPFPDSCGEFERICITDDMSIEPNGWKLMELDAHYLDASRASRHPKLLPHHYFPEFEWSLYIDNTVKFKIDPLMILNLYAEREKGYWCFRHPWRDCVYDEAEEVILAGKEDERCVREQMDYYRAMGYPERAGLCANGVLLRRHNDSAVVRLGEIWFEHVLRFSKRDQLSFNFIAEKLKFEYGIFDGNQITDNQIILWPGYPDQARLPQGFDEDVYMWLNPEVQKSGMSPRQHYMTVGASKGLVYKKKSWDLDRLANKYKTDKGSIYYNAHAYAAVYEKYFDPIREQPVKLLELGLLRHDIQVKNPGGPYDDVPSLFIWREYFPNAEIVGFDIADFSKVREIPNCKIVRGDIGNINDLVSLVSDGGFDIIIDDASHASHHQQTALGTLFPFLKEGGYYIIEDLNYQPPHLELPQLVKTKKILKSLCCGELIPTQFLNETQLNFILKNNDLLEFYDSFDRNFNGPTSDSLVIIKKCGQELLVEALTNQLKEQGRENRSQIVEKDAQITEINRSKAWKFALFLRHARVKFLPPGSRREKLTRWLYHAFK
jgi:hypothetical protein